MGTPRGKLTAASAGAPAPVVLPGPGCCGLCGIPLSAAGTPPESGLAAVHLASAQPLCNRCRGRREDFTLRALALGRLVRARQAAGSTRSGGGAPPVAGRVAVDAGLLLLGGLWHCSVGEDFGAFARQEAWAPFAACSPRQLPAAAAHLLERRLLRPAAAVTPDGRPYPRPEDPRAISSGQYALYQLLLPPAGETLAEFLSLLRKAGVDTERVLGARFTELSRRVNPQGGDSGRQRPPSGPSAAVEITARSLL